MTLKNYFGLVLMTIGGLIAIFSGGCTLMMIGTTFFNINLMLPVRIAVVTAIGALPFFLGVALFRKGKSMAGKKPPEEKP